MNQIKCKGKVFYAVCEPKEYECNFCNFKGHNKLDIYEHLKSGCKITSIYEPTELNCEHCSMTAHSRLFLLKHHRDCIRFLKLTCLFCKPALSKYKKLFSCDQCSYKAPLARILKNHELKHRKMWQKYSHKAKQSEQLIEKRLEQQSKPMFHCSDCLYQTRLKAHMWMHVQRKHTPLNELTWFRCEICPYKGKLEKDLKMHMRRRHMSDKKMQWFFCDMCSYKSNLKANWGKHVLRQHGDPAEIDWFRCEKCSYKAKQKGHLKIHMRDRHTPAEEIDWFCCEQCPYKTKRSNLCLKQHVLSCHTPANEIEWLHCEKCSYKSKVKRNLNRHLQVHHVT